MKRLFTVIISLFILHAAQADSMPTDSIRTGNLPNQIAVNHPDTILTPAVAPVPFLDAQSLMYKRRLDSIKKDVPFDYNEYVQSYIDIYMQRPDEMARILGLTKYYFPIYEKAFREVGIPDEIKFLSIVESKLDPNAVSRSGATGPWQFMRETAKLYHLNMDSYVDERCDPIQASYATAAYMKDAYQQFGDWLLAIASYNCGSGAITRAIAKAGGVADFWVIRQYLPLQTRNYVPAYIAISYVMNYYSKHNIIPQACNYSLKNDTVMVDKYISLNNVSQILGIDLKELALLNPSYKKLIVNGTLQTPRRLIIPQTGNETFGALYSALNDDTAPAPIPVASVPQYAEAKKEDAAAPAYHKVKKGETLADVADEYSLTVRELKVWNNLHGSKVARGTKLRLKEPEVEKKEERHSYAARYVTYKVRRGDTISTIADKFDGASVDKIKELNRLKSSRLQPGMTLKITHI